MDSTGNSYLLDREWDNIILTDREREVVKKAYETASVIQASQTPEIIIEDVPELESVLDEPIQNTQDVQPSDAFTEQVVEIWRKRVHNLLLTLDIKVLRRLCKGTKEKGALLKLSRRDLATFISEAVVSGQALVDTIPPDVLVILCRKINPSLKITTPRILKPMLVKYLYNQ